MPSPPPPPPPGRQRAVVAVERTVVARGAREPSAAGALVGAPVAELDLDRPATIIGRLDSGARFLARLDADPAGLIDAPVIGRRVRVSAATPANSAVLI